jgi:hypothetical protein
MDDDSIEKHRKISFNNPVELLIIILLILFSLFVLNGYLLDALNLRLKMLNITLLLVVETLPFLAIFKNVRVFFDIKSFMVCAGLFSAIVLFSIHFSTMPVSGSVDAVHHYVLIDYLYNHESLPTWDYMYYMGEMVQYPFGASLVTAQVSRILDVVSVRIMQPLAGVVAGLIGVLVYLIALEFLEGYGTSSDFKWIMALVSPFLLLFIPDYFLGQYFASFFYSMMFGELLVLGTLLALMKIEKGEVYWIYIFFILNIGIIFTYTLFIVTPLLAAGIWLLVNKEPRKYLDFKQCFFFFLLLVGLFAIYSYERFDVGKSILQHEGAALVPSTSNLNVIFIILVSAGIILYIIENYRAARGAVVVYTLTVFLEILLFVFLNHYGLIAKYFAYKMFYLQTFLLSLFASIPLTRLVKHLDNISKKRHLTILCYGSIPIILSIIVLIYMTLMPQVNIRPVITMDDLKISQCAATYRFEGNLTDDNITIIAPKIKAYWIANGFLHMDKNYAINEYLLKEHNLNEWLNNKNSSYLIISRTKLLPDFIKTHHLIVRNREGNVLFLQKTNKNSSE